ncbi:hypothetical protein OQA88_8942 [Cercophora sp. LCS_1]
MANPPQDINAILRFLGDAANRPAGTTPNQAQPGLPAPAAPPMSSNPYAQPPPNPYAAPPPSGYQPPPYSYPAPASSGSIDLSSIRPVNSGTVPIGNSSALADAVAKAKAFAAEKGFQPYDRPTGGYPAQDSRGADDRRYLGRDRSKSPRGRESFRDNPYRDERRGDHGGQRDYGRDRSYSPGRGRQGFSPRGAGGGRDRSPLRGGRDGGNTETIEIEANLVGLIIGRQGENLRRVETDSGCRVQFIPSAGQNERVRFCKITGNAAAREMAKDMINTIIRDSGMRAGGRGGPDAGGYGGRESRPAPPPVPASKDSDDSLQIMVPDRTVGLIIGRGGETIRDLQERSGCHINIVGENKSVNGLRPVNLIGSPESQRKAKDFILEIVESDSRNSGAQSGGGPGPAGGGRSGRNDNFGGGGGGGGERVNDSIYVPSDAVGMIIGKGGETIREMQNSTGCKINVSQSSGPGETEREIELVGSRDSIARAKRAIEDKVDAARQKGAGGGGRGGPRGQHRDYDNPNYGQPSNNSMPSNAQPASAAVTAPAGAGSAADPYAAYGGYENYVALWYQASQQAQQAQQPGSS